jgi:hypothetical protein
MKIEKVKISEVKNNPNNPRVIKGFQYFKLVKSIKEAPWMLQLRSIIVNDDNVVLGGNQRLRACKDAGLKEVYIIKASSLTEEQQREFIIKDNLSAGEWDWDALANEFEVETLDDWGLKLPVKIEDSDEFGTAFDLPDGDKEPFQQMTFRLADEQANQVRNAIDDIKRTEEYKYCETMGNDNSNGNALYLIIMQWAEQKK